MKKILPIVVIVLAIIAGLMFFLRPKGDVGASLTPSDDRRWLKLEVDGISNKTESLEYVLTYDLPDGRTQGVPGKVELEGKSSFERDILLGSESAGKYTYDEGVNAGTLTLKFFDDKEKQIDKYEVEWNINELPDNPDVI